MNLKPTDIDEELLKELFPEYLEDFVFENELTGERIYVSNKKKRMAEKKRKFNEAISKIKSGT